MSKREPSVLLDDIHTSIEKIQRYTAGLDESSFRTSVQSIPLAPFSGTHLTIQRFNSGEAISVHSWKLVRRGGFVVNGTSLTASYEGWIRELVGKEHAKERARYGSSVVRENPPNAP